MHNTRIKYRSFFTCQDNLEQNIAIKMIRTVNLVQDPVLYKQLNVISQYK